MDALREIAKRYIWWQSPDETLARRDHFLCQLMALGTIEDTRLARRFYGDDAFREALQHAPPGVFDARSWNFWHLLLLRQPPPPLPVREIP